MYSFASAPQRIQFREWIGSGFLLPFCALFLVGHEGLGWLETTSLVLHDLGHLAGAPLGAGVTHALGLLAQVMVPLLFVRFFYLRTYCFGVQVFLFWFAQNLLHLRMSLGADTALPSAAQADGLRDWAYVLEGIGLAGSEPTVALALGAGAFISFIVLLLLPGLWARSFQFS